MISLNLGANPQHKLQCLNKWNIFKSRGLYFIHLNINSLLPKIEELRIIVKSTNAAIIGISESKLDNLFWNLRFKLITIKFFNKIDTETEVV